MLLQKFSNTVEQNGKSKNCEASNLDAETNAKEILESSKNIQKFLER